MFTQEQYLLGWGCYIAAAILLILLVWYLVRRFWAYPKHVIIISTACILLTPYYIDNAESHLAPAFLMAAIEIAFNKFDFTFFWRAGKPLLVSWFSVLIAYFSLLALVMLAKNYFSAKSAKASSSSKSAGHPQNEQAGERVEPSFQTDSSLSMIAKPMAFSSEQVLHSSQQPSFDKNEPTIDESQTRNPLLKDPVYGNDSERDGLVEDSAATSDSDAPFDDRTIIRPLTRNQLGDPLSQSDNDDDFNDNLEASLELQTGLEFDIDRELDNLTNPDRNSKKPTAIDQQCGRNPKDSV